MAVLTQDDLKQLIAAMTEVVTTAIQETKRTDTTKGHIDHRAIGGPPEWDSAKEENFLEWQIKVQAWLVNQDPSAIA